ncbi:MAG: DNA gyrase subunit A [Planctomycetota bacterium]
MSPESPPPDTPAAPPLPEPEDRVRDLSIERELAESYLTYAMSTIVDRALPDVRDGMKPSQRRILVAMNDLNLRPGAQHRKCAKIAGDTSGNYHPHGEGVVYPTLVGMAQTWKTRHPLVDPQGNFGSIDPDPPAAMRYTEARLAGPAAEMLEDLKLETVDWQDNYDGTRQEPKVLPGRFPNLLVNGGLGIAVGMATSLPPHNLGEVCDAITMVIDKPESTLADLLEVLPGPDFPTGGIICGRAGIAHAYATGRGRVTVRAKIHHEEKGNRDQLVITEIPYQLTKNDGIIDKIVRLRRADRLADISDIVDESSGRTGMRVVILLKRGADPTVVENQLYQLTPLQSTFSIINIALVRGQPRTLTLRELIDRYVEHRVEVIRRRTAFKLKQARQEAHKIEGLIFAVVDIDEVIKLIRSSRTRDEAIRRLMERGFRIPDSHPAAPDIPQRLKDAAESSADGARLSRVQAEAIGRLQLIQLVGLEIEQLIAKYRALLEEIDDYEEILAKDERVMQIIRDDLSDLRAKYANPRRTEIQAGEVNELAMADLVPVEQVVVTITHRGYVKRLAVDQYKQQGRGGKGVIGSKSRDDDFTEHVFVSSSHDDLLCFTDTGRVFKLKVFEIPEAGRTGRGTAVVNLLQLQPEERICAWMPISDFEKGEYFLMFATRNGLVKRSALKDYRNVNRSGLIAVGLREGDALVHAEWTGGQDHVILATQTGMAIRFGENDARVMGRSASGVKGVDLAAGDSVVGMVKVVEGEEGRLLTVTERGYGKRTDTAEYLVQSEDGAHAQSRGGKGRRDMKVTERSGPVAQIKLVSDEDDLILLSQSGMVTRIAAATVRHTGRNTQGVRVMTLGDDDRLAAVAPVPHEGDEEPDEGGEGDSPDADADADADGGADA